MKILHKIEDINFYVNEDMQIIDCDGHFIYCQFHQDHILYLRHDGFISCVCCEKILNIKEFR